MLLKAFRRIVDYAGKAKLIIIGDGSQRKNLERQVKDIGLQENVQFWGVRTDVPELLANMDVLALSSKEEGLPMALLEAMAAGKPVVATNVGGIPSVVKPYETGLLVPKGDTDAMAAALLFLYQNKELSKKIGENGRRFIEESYDLKKILALYHSLYKNL